MKEVTMSNNLPLHKTTHWRRFRNIVNAIFKLENVDSSRYNAEKVTCYRAVGEDMQGRNVTFKRTGR